MIDRNDIADLAKPFRTTWLSSEFGDVLTVSEGNRHVDTMIGETELALGKADFNRRIMLPIKYALSHKRPPVGDFVDG